MPRYASGSVMRRGSGPVTLKASGAETASTNGAAIDIGDAAALYLKVDVTAASGTSPTLVVVIEASFDGGTTWFELGRVGTDYRVGSVGTVANLTAAAATHAAFPAGGSLVRSRSIIGGTTPSFTYSVVGEAA